MYQCITSGKVITKLSDLLFLINTVNLVAIMLTSSLARVGTMENNISLKSGHNNRERDVRSRNGNIWKNVSSVQSMLISRFNEHHFRLNSISLKVVLIFPDKVVQHVSGYEQDYVRTNQGQLKLVRQFPQKTRSFPDCFLVMCMDCSINYN